MKLFQKIMFVSGFSLVFPLATFAQDGAGTQTFVNSFSLWIAVVVAIAASLLVFANARRMKGGVVGKALNSFALGMFLVMLGFFGVVIPPWAPHFVIMRVHDALFIIGYVVMALGAKRLLDLTAKG